MKAVILTVLSLGVTLVSMPTLADPRKDSENELCLTYMKTREAKRRSHLTLLIKSFLINMT